MPSGSKKDKKEKKDEALRSANTTHFHSMTWHAFFFDGHMRHSRHSSRFLTLMVKDLKVFPSVRVLVIFNLFVGQSEAKTLQLHQFITKIAASFADVNVVLLPLASYG